MLDRPSCWLPAGGRLASSRRIPLPANMSETVAPLKFRVEGEAGSESDERIGAGPRWAGDRGGGEGDAAKALDLTVSQSVLVRADEIISD